MTPTSIPADGHKLLCVLADCLPKLSGLNWKDLIQKPFVHIILVFLNQKIAYASFQFQLSIAIAFVVSAVISLLTFYPSLTRTEDGQISIIYSSGG